MLSATQPYLFPFAARLTSSLLLTVFFPISLFSSPLDPTGMNCIPVCSWYFTGGLKLQPFAVRVPFRNRGIKKLFGLFTLRCSIHSYCLFRGTGSLDRPLTFARWNQLCFYSFPWILKGTIIFIKYLWLIYVCYLKSISGIQYNQM